MVVRYAVRMARRPDQRWTGGTIPIIFHVVLAAFQWTFAQYHVGLFDVVSGFSRLPMVRLKADTTAARYGFQQYHAAFVIARTARGASRAMLKSPPRAS